MTRLNSNYRKNIKVLWELSNRLIKSSVKNRIETLTDGSSSSSFSSHAGAVKILKSHNENL